MIFDSVQPNSVIKIDGIKGKQLVTRCYRHHGGMMVNIRPLGTKTNHPVQTIDTRKYNITILGKGK